MRTPVLISLLALGACTSLSLEERDQLALYQRNAKLYWDGNRLPQALIQIERGLQIEPDDYTLSTMYGAILLKQSPSSLGEDHRMLDEATRVLGRMFETRSERRHEPALLFNYALALQKQSRRHTGEATRLLALAERDPETDVSGLDDLERRAEDNLARANHLFGLLIERGELVRICHYHLLLGARDVSDHAAIERHRLAYFERTATEQSEIEAEVERTNVPRWEQYQKTELANLRLEELQVRSLLADYYYDREQYEQALDMLNRVLALDPARSTDYYNRGRVLLQLGRDADAKSDFRKFLATTDLPASSDKAMFAAAEVSK